VGELLRVVPLMVTAVFLLVMYRKGYRGEAARILLATAALFTGSHAVGATTGWTALLNGVCTVFVYVSLVIGKRPAQWGLRADAPPVIYDHDDRDNIGPR
jgi:hypothetical protein